MSGADAAKWVNEFLGGLSTWSVFCVFYLTAILALAAARGR